MSTKEQKVSEEEGLYATIIVGDYDEEEFDKDLGRWIHAAFQYIKRVRAERIKYMKELITKVERGEPISRGMIEYLIKFPDIEEYWTDEDKRWVNILRKKLERDPKYKSALELLIKNLR